MDCPINHKKGKQWYSHKFKGSALRYELATNIQTGDIVHMNGPFLPGLMNDITIFRMGLKQKLEKAGEKCEADAGYKGEINTIRTPDVFISSKDMRAKARARARHETVNGRVKEFKCISEKYRHVSVKKHEKFFRSAVALTQILFNLGEKPFQCKY